jgi:tRNA G18 (ribose-2'-O)-methylase SpoU
LKCQTREGQLLNKDVHYQDKKVFVFGNEGQGISREVLEVVDNCYYININNIESLNVSCAAAIIFYQFLAVE